MITAEDLLKPISPEKPCGDDISYDPGFLELETLLRGKPETQFSPAEEPNWKDVRERCVELWKRSKDLRVATVLAIAELKSADGFGGFRECLAAINGLVEKYWNDFYPRLDPADGNDPTERVNIIASMAAPVGTFGDPMRVLERLREAPLAMSSRMGKFSASDIARSQDGTPGPDNKPPPSLAQIEAAFKDTSKEALTALAKNIGDSVGLVASLDDGLTRVVGSGKAADLGALKGQLQEIQKRLNPFLPDGVAIVGEVGAMAAEASTGSASSSKAISGDIQSRQDVSRMLEKICDYYARHEPSSPVPYLLKRAQRLAEKNFMDIITDMSPDALDAITKITGQKPPPAPEQQASA